MNQGDLGILLLTILTNIISNLNSTRFGTLIERLKTTRIEYEIEELITSYIAQFMKFKNILKDFRSRCSQFRIKELSERVKRKRSLSVTPTKRRKVVPG